MHGGGRAEFVARLVRHLVSSRPVIVTRCDLHHASAAAEMLGTNTDAVLAPDRTTWVALDNDAVVAAARELERSDGRLFVRFAGELPHVADLSAHVARQHRRNIYASADAESDTEKSLRAAGFTVEVTGERFDVRFGAALASLRRAPPHPYRILDARDVEPDQLFELDNALRDLVPGTNGWQGNRAWFDSELTDPGSYLVAAMPASDRLVGLARMWNNPSRPRFGLVGVLPEHRRPSPAVDLLRRVISEASSWGHDSFTTETTTVNRVVHPRLRRIGTPTGQFHQMVRSFDPSSD